MPESAELLKCSFCGKSQKQVRKLIAGPGGQYLQDKLSKNNEIKLYDNYDNAYIDLKSGRIDAILSEKVTATEWLKQNNDKYAIVGNEMDNHDNIAIAVRKGDALKGEFDKALTALQNNGELAKLQKQHFGQ